MDAGPRMDCIPLLTLGNWSWKCCTLPQINTYKDAGTLVAPHRLTEGHQHQNEKNTPAEILELFVDHIITNEKPSLFGALLHFCGLMK